MAKDKFGRELVRAISDPHSGRILTGRLVSEGDNFTDNLNGAGASPNYSPEPHIEGVIVRSHHDNTGIVRILRGGGIWQEGYPLSAGEAVSIGTNRLSNVIVFIGTNGEEVNYLAIEKAR